MTRGWRVGRRFGLEKNCRRHLLYGFGMGLLALSHPASAAGWQASLGSTTDYVHRGLSQTDGHGALQAGIDYRFARGYYTGAWASSIDAPPGETQFEVDYLAGLSRPIDERWSWNLGLGRYTYPDHDRAIDYDYNELSGALSFRDSLSLSIAWSPRMSAYVQGAVHHGPVATYEASAQWPLSSWLSATAGLGYHDRRELDDLGYPYWSAGLSLHYGRHLIDLTRFGVGATARERYGDDRAGDRTVLSWTIRFGNS